MAFERDNNTDPLTAHQDLALEGFLEEYTSEGVPGGVRAKID